MKLVLALVLVARAGTALADPAESHLLAGVDLFRDERFELALVELKVSKTLGGRGDVDWYIAATLTKLHRAEEALEVFAGARAAAPDAGDALLDYYQAVACYEARLLLCADALLAGVEAGAGPKVAGQARKVRADIAAALRGEPPVAAVDAALDRGRAALAAGRAGLAGLYFEEALGLSRRRGDHHGQAAAAEGREAARRATSGGARR